MSHSVVIYFDMPGAMDYPFSERIYYESYRNFSAEAAKSDIAITIARGDSYRGSMQFSNGWQFVDGELTAVATPIQADLIYNKSQFGALVSDPNDLVINPPAFDDIARNKWTSYQALREFCPITYQINNGNWREVFDKIPTNRVVLKPELGFGGTGIHVAIKSELDFPKLGLTDAYIAQEFIDSSGGIPGICSGYHDLRILLFGGQPKLAFLRQPKAGSLLSNVSQGGTATAVEISQVPEQIIASAAAIDQRFGAFYPRFYSADFFVQNGRPYLVETNTQPGFPHPDVEGASFTEQYYGYLIDIFCQALAART